MGGLIRDEAGNLYGTTQYGGGTAVTCKYGCGTVFRLSPPTKGKSGWTEEILHRFAAQFATSHVEDGVGPVNNLAFGPSGGLYGNTFRATSGFLGYAFELLPPARAGLPWTENIIIRPSKSNGDDSFFPSVKVTFDSLGNLWFGGQSISPPVGSQLSWVPGKKYLGVNAVAFDNSGNLYVVNASGEEKALSGGFVEEYSPDLSTYTPLYQYQSFLEDSWPMVDRDGAVYFDAPYGGYQGKGGVYKLSPPPSGSGNWTSQLIYSFKETDGLSCPATGLSQDSDGAIYGVASLKNPLIF
jgi:uncharacterized repeat protein (TIGR03803 family)